MKDTKIKLNDKAVKTVAGEMLTLNNNVDFKGTVTGLDIADITGLSADLAAKQAIIIGAASTIASLNLTASRALVSDASGKVAVSTITATQLGYVSGVTSAIQTQLNSKAASTHSHTDLMSVEGGSDATIGRTVNRPTSDYNRKLMLEFKDRASVGLGGSGTYAGLLTMAAYSDASSGETHSQIGYNGDNVQYRKGTYGSAWGGWKTFAFQDWVTSNFSSSSHTHTFASITSKPTTLSGYGITDAASSSHSHTFASITSKPTTLSGYGITDAASSNHTHSYLPLTGGTLTGSLEATIIHSNSNGAGSNFKVGDDAWIGDINQANTMSVRGVNDASQGYIIFGNANNNSLGRSGAGPLTYGGDFTATGNITAYSDAKLKTNVRPYGNGIEKVKALRPVIYDRIDIESDDEIGFIAQEVQEVEPTLIVNCGDILTLDYSRMVVMLTSAVQTQQKQIEALTKRIEELENGGTNQ